MTELTKEWLLRTIAELEEERDAVLGAVNEDAAKALMAMKLALASLEAEPVAYMSRQKAELREKFGTCDEWDLHHQSVEAAFPSVNIPESDNYEFMPLYTAPPAQVAVPEEITSANAPEIFEIAAEAERLGLRGTFASYAVGWNACRAAMLKTGKS